MREEERTRRERGEYARRRHAFTKRKKESPSKRKPQQKEGDASSRVARRAFFSSRRRAKTLDDRFSSFPTHSSTRRRPRSRVSTVACARPRAVLDIISPPRHFLFPSSRERKREREPQKHREKNEKKKEAPTGGPTRDLRTPAQPPSLARSHKDRRENRGSSSIEKTRAARERERERERESHRVVPFFRSYKQNVKTMKVSSSPKQKKPKPFLQWV
jgi:hypothetical protein